MIRYALQLPRFSVPGVGSDRLFDSICITVAAAEAAGFDAVFVMDHVHQLPQIGDPWLEMPEAYTLLAGLAARTERVLLGTLVTGVTYRNPALLAKMVTTLDVVSVGRALLGIGAAWFDDEHRAYGYRFPPAAERLDRLEDAVRICRAMFTDPCATVTGTTASVDGAWNVPRPVNPGGPPILIGGQGERRTLRIAAEHADIVNTNPAFGELGRKLDALHAHCADIGRDPGEITTTNLGSLVMAPTREAALDKLATLTAPRGISRNQLDDPDTLAAISQRMYVGDPDDVGEQLAAVLATGLDGVVVNLPADAHDPDAVAHAGEVLALATRR